MSEEKELKKISFVFKEGEISIEADLDQDGKPSVVGSFKYDFDFTELATELVDMVKDKIFKK